MESLKTEKLAVAGEQFQIFQLRRQLQLLTELQVPYEEIYWVVEQEKSRLKDRIARLDADR